MLDYQKLGFRCGIEIHNRLNTEHKLFCSCSTKAFTEKPVKIIKRKLRAVAGELGKTDAAALYEYTKNRTYTYQIFPKGTCLVETDSEPPKQVNREALETALQIAKLLKADIPEEIHIMRKTVIDGSNTSGFQRTALIGANGILNTSKGKVRIANICLEEEASGIADKKQIIYRLDRLGIPLIEIGTETDIKDPEHAKETAEKLGMIVRSTGKSQRGLGVTRQDINISIKNGKRIEIKGFQDLDSIPLVIEKEVERQIGLVKIGKSEEETRVANPDGTSIFTRPLPGGERMYPETDVPPIKIDREFLKKIKAPETWEQKLEKFKKILPKDMAEQILKSEYLDLFEKFSKSTEPVLVANLFLSILKDLKRKGIDTDKLSEEIFQDIFLALEKQRMSKEAIPEVIENLCKSPELTIGEVIAKLDLSVLTEGELKSIIRKIFEKYPELAKEKRIAALMGEVMKEVRGKIDGQTVMRVLKEEIG